MARAETTAGRKAAYKAGNALPPASRGAAPGFPITDAAHWEKARRAVGRVKDPGRRQALAKLLRRTAPKFGKTAALNQSWAAPAGAKAMAVTGQRALTLAGGPEPYSREPDENVQCPDCGKYNADDARFCDQCGAKLPDSAFSGIGLANTSDVLSRISTALGETDGQLSGTSGGSRRSLPVASASDVLISRGENGQAIIRHRRGGDKIGEIRHETGGWKAIRGDKPGSPHTHQRAALTELIGLHNREATGSPLQPRPEQTPAMRQLGIPAIRLATPATGVSDGPRVTTADSDGDSDGPAGLTPRGLMIYKKLIGKGLPAARALQFARNAQRRAAKAAS